MDQGDVATEFAAPLLGAVIEAYAAGDWNVDALKTTMERLMEPFGIKLGKAQAGTRVAVTGRSVGPPLFEVLEVMGRDETLRRLEAALATSVMTDQTPPLCTSGWGERPDAGGARAPTRLVVAPAGRGRGARGRGAAVRSTT